MIFKYQAKRGPKEKLSGKIEAVSENEAINLLTEKGLSPIKIEEEKTAGAFPKKDIFLKKPSLRISQKELLDFSRQAYNLFCAHVELLKILNILRQQFDNPKLKQVISDIHGQIKEGKNLSSALEAFPQIFSPIYVSLVKAGQVSGRLDLSFQRISFFLEQKQDLRRKVLSALAYPAMMVLVGIGTMIVLITFVIPRLSFLFGDLGQNLPLITRFLFSISSLFNQSWFWIIIASIVIFFSVYQRFFSHKISFENIIRKLPFFRKVSYLESIAHFSYAFGVLLASGVSILESLRISRLSLGKSPLSKEVASLEEQVTNGSSLATASKSLVSFPKFFASMLTIGEESASLPQMMNTTTTILMKELDLKLKVFSSLIEPIIILAVGLILGIMIIAILLPILEMSGLVI